MKQFLHTSAFLLLGLLANAQDKNDHPEYALSELNPVLLIGANEVVRESEQRVEIKNARSGRITTRKVVTVLNEDSDANRISIRFKEDQKVRKLAVSIYDAQGKFLREIDKDEIRDYPSISSFSIYDDDRMLLVDALHSAYPYTIAYTYEQELEDILLAVFPDWRPQSFQQSVEQASYEVIVPEDLTLQYRVLNLDSLRPEMRVDRGVVHYRFTTGPLRAPRSEPYQPGHRSILPMVLCNLNRFEIDGYVGSMESWQEFGAFIHRLNLDRSDLPQEVAAEVRNICADLESDQEKVSALYRDVQEHMRYVSVQLGIGGWQPFAASYVAENRYGDCKALSNYMRLLLAEVGIEAHCVLLKNGRSSYALQQDFTYPSFNHMILYVPGTDTWLECTSNSFPPGYIGQNNSDRDVLLITEEGGKIARTPRIRAEDNHKQIEIHLQIDENGAAKIRFDNRLRGPRHEIIRRVQRQLSTDKQGEWVIQYTNASNFSLQDFTLQAEKNRPAAHLQFTGQVPRYAAKAGSRLFVPMNVLSRYQLTPQKLKLRK